MKMNSRHQAWLLAGCSAAATFLMGSWALAQGRAPAQAQVPPQGQVPAQAQVPPQDAGAAAAPQKSEKAIKDEARRLWQEGLDAAEADNAELALARLRESLALYPHVGTLRNLGIVELAFDEYAADGANHLAYYLANSQDLVPEDKRRLRDLVAAAEKKIGRIDLEIESPGATLEVDGNRIEPPLTKRVLYVLPGSHELVVRQPDAEPIERALVLGPGERESVYVGRAKSSHDAPEVAEPNVASASGTRAPAAQPASEQWSDGKLWAVATGAGLAAVGLGVAIYGEVALGAAKDDARDARAAVDEAFGGEGGCFEPARAESRICQRLDDSASEQESAGALATTGWIASGILAAATTAAWLLWPNERAEAKATRGVGVTAVGVGPWSPSGGAGLVVSGGF